MQNYDFYNESLKNIKNTELSLLTDISNIILCDAAKDTKLVEHIVSRIKTPESSIDKLKKAGYEPTEQNALNVLSDVIGVRLVVHFLNDIYTVRNLIVNSGKFDILKEKDYVLTPKPSGYRGYHIIITTNYNGFQVKAEIQIRTIAMDCWASLEHQIRYKKNIVNTKLISAELKRCSDDLMSADIAMEQICNMVKETDTCEGTWLDCSVHD